MIRTIYCQKKNGELYVWSFRLGQEDQVLRSIGKMAADDRLSLTWPDAARGIEQLYRRPQPDERVSRREP